MCHFPILNTHQNISHYLVEPLRFVHTELLGTVHMDYQHWPAVTQLLLQETQREWTLSNDVGQNALTIMNIIKNGYSTYSYLIHN